jgi:hypothetical protein
MKFIEPKCNTVARTSCSSEWAIRTLVGIVTHKVPLPGAPTIGVSYRRQVNFGMFVRLIWMVGLRDTWIIMVQAWWVPYVQFK